MRAPPVLPGVPVAREEFVVDAAGGLALGLRLRALGVALQGGAVGENLEGDGEPDAIRRESEAAHVERELGHLGGLTAVDGQAPHLRGAAARGEEEEAAAVGSPERLSVGVGVRGELAQAGAVGIDEPEIIPAAVSLHVRGAEHEGNALAVRGDAWAAEAAQRHLILNVVRVGLGGRGGKRQGHQERQGQGFLRVERG
jgi:hypothetical protein